MYTIGIDFGTESGRVVVVDCHDGREVATMLHPYSQGVIDQRLPGSDQPLPTAMEEFFGVVPCTLMSMASNGLIP